MIMRYFYFFLFLDILVLWGCRDSSEEYSQSQENESKGLSENFKMIYDSRNGKVYRIISLRDRDWIAENLNFQTENSWCYRDSSEYCDRYGRLYSWGDAMKACPEGWKLPDNEDWIDLRKAASNDSRTLSELYKLKISGFDRMPGYRKYKDVRWRYAGTNLKAIEGWFRAIDTPRGIDMLGFGSLPGGMRKLDASYDGVKTDAYFWSATKGDSTRAYVWNLWYNAESLSSGYESKWHNPDGFFGNGFSVRCVRVH